MTTQIRTRRETGTWTGPVQDRIGQGRVRISYLGSSGTADANIRLLIQEQSSDGQSLLQQRFARLAETWRNETGMHSIALKKVVHPAYLRTVGLGRGVIPLVLNELRDRGGYWYPALEALVGYDPIHDSDHLSIRELKARWLEWGRRQGYVA